MKRNLKGQFVKGHNTPLSEETKKKISEGCKKSGVGKWMQGRKISVEIRKKMSINAHCHWLGKKRGKQSKELIEKRIAPLRGRKRPDLTKRLLENNPNKGRFGKEHPKWVENKKNPFYLQIRSLFKYVEWRNAIFARDNWICNECGIRGGLLQVHHLNKFSNIIKKFHIETIDNALNCPELWDIDNGITLCKKCHYKNHSKIK